MAVTGPSREWIEKMADAEDAILPGIGGLLAVSPELLTEMRTENVIRTAKLLAEKLRVVEADANYQSVWSLAYLHGGQYRGPTYGEELAELEVSLKMLEG